MHGEPITWQVQPQQSEAVTGILAFDFCIHFLKLQYSRCPSLSKDPALANAKKRWGNLTPVTLQSALRDCEPLAQLVSQRTFSCPASNSKAKIKSFTVLAPG
jgi:hypothetical protein